MLVPQNFEAKIGFATLRELLEQLCLSALGRQYVAQMQFITKPRAAEQAAGPNRRVSASCWPVAASFRARTTTT
ncbi:MAG: hypothetical protein WKG07_43085 [Hymenobacter sp.]